MKFFYKKLIPLFLSIILLTSILSPRIINAEEPNQSSTLINCSDGVCCDVYRKLAQRLGLEPEDLESRLLFKINQSTYRLVPLTNSAEHREFWKKLYCYADPSYMRFFLTGEMKSEEAAMLDFDRRWNRMYGTEKPCSMTFISLLDGQLSGRISVSNLSDHRSPPEIGYTIDKENSGKGLATCSVKNIISFLQYLKDVGKYTFASVFATAHPGNIGSCRVLGKSLFSTDGQIKEFPYGPVKVYTYNFS